MKIIIHACNSRLWYVTKYLKPSLVSQGISEDDVEIIVDDKEIGCLEKCMEIFNSMPNDHYDTWHLQDDVIVCKDFYSRAKDLSNEPGIMNGFCWKKDMNRNVTGRVYDPFNMWFSFPCIRIPNFIARKCGEWYFREAKRSSKWLHWVGQNKGDDSMFKGFLENYWDKMLQFPIYNIAPNLVDHIDYLIGGTVVNKERERKIGDFQSRAMYFNDYELIEELEKKLKEDSKWEK